MRKEQIINYLKPLRESIISAFENFEPNARFERKPWENPSLGSGEMAVIRGDVFEKAAVNFSAVSGEKFPMADGAGPFFATGISLITHMKNPKAPTVHMNIRYIETEKKTWLAGGYDLTPMGFPFDEDTEHFHNTARQALGDVLYNDFSRQAKEYFYIPHRKKERGVGGIFFDHYSTCNFDDDLTLWKRVGDTFLQSICPIYEKRIHLPYTQSDRDLQLTMRGHYAEFNLIYDRGTKFGFASGGNPEAILCSMPPLTAW